MTTKNTIPRILCIIKLSCLVDTRVVVSRLGNVVRNKKLLGAPGIVTRSKDAMIGAPGHTTRIKKLLAYCFY